MFAEVLFKLTPFPQGELKASIMELIEYDLIEMGGGCLINPDMVKKAEISAKRAIAGKESVERRKGKVDVKSEYETKSGSEILSNLKQKNGQNFVELLFRAHEGARAPLPSYLDKGNIKRVRSIEGGVGENSHADTHEEKPQRDHPTTKVEERIVKNLMNVEDLLQKYFTSPTFARQREALAMANYLGMEDLIRWGQAFNVFLISNAIDRDEFGNVVKTENDWATHFARWIQKQDLKLDPDNLTEERRKKFLGYKAKYPEKNVQKTTHELDEKIARENDPDKRRELEFLKYRVIPPEGAV